MKKICTCQNEVTITIGARGVIKKFLRDQFYLEEEHIRDQFYLKEEADRFLIILILEFVHYIFQKFVLKAPN